MGRLCSFWRARRIVPFRDNAAQPPSQAQEFARPITRACNRSPKLLGPRLASGSSVQKRDTQRETVQSRPTRVIKLRASVQKVTSSGNVCNTLQKFSALTTPPATLRSEQYQNPSNERGRKENDESQRWKFGGYCRVGAVLLRIACIRSGSLRSVHRKLFHHIC